MWLLGIELRTSGRTNEPSLQPYLEYLILLSLPPKLLGLQASASMSESMENALDPQCFSSAGHCLLQPFSFIRGLSIYTRLAPLIYTRLAPPIYTGLAPRSFQLSYLS